MLNSKSGQDNSFKEEFVRGTNVKMTFFSLYSLFLLCRLCHSRSHISLKYESVVTSRGHKTLLQAGARAKWLLIVLFVYVQTQVFISEF